MQNWQNCLYSILKRLDFEQKDIDRKIDSIQDLMHNSKQLGSYKEGLKEYILLLSFSSPYVTSYLLLLPEKNLLYDCTDDEKTGAGDQFEQYALLEEEVKVIKTVDWPECFSRGTADAKGSRSFQYIFD